MASIWRHERVNLAAAELIPKGSTGTTYRVQATWGLSESIPVRPGRPVSPSPADVLSGIFLAMASATDPDLTPAAFPPPMFRPCGGRGEDSDLWASPAADLSRVRGEAPPKDAADGGKHSRADGLDAILDSTVDSSRVKVGQ